MDLVQIQNKEPVTTSLIVADGMKIKHRAIMELVDKYSEELKEFGLFTVQTLKVPMGRPVRYATINEGQTGYLISLMRNSSIVREFKRNLMKAFLKQRKIISQLLAQQQNEQWLKQRTIGKIARRQETDTIKEFIDYAKEQGSVHAGKYYMLFTQATNKALFILEQEFDGVRDFLNGQQLQILSSADYAVSRAIQEGMVQGMHYKDIYKLAKQRLDQFSEVIGKSIVPIPMQQKLI